MRLRQLKIIRIQNEFTQQQIADVLGISRSAYCGYETGRRSPDIDALIKLADFYGITVDKFFEKCQVKYVYNDEFLDEQPEARYMAQLTKEERDLIINLRISSEEVKKDILEYAHKKSGRVSL